MLIQVINFWISIQKTPNLIPENSIHTAHVCLKRITQMSNSHFKFLNEAFQELAHFHVLKAELLDISSMLL